MLNRCILSSTGAILPRSVGALCGDKMLDAEFMPDEMHRHPIWKVCPLPRKDELADWRMFREKNRLLPLGGRFLCALRHADCSAGGIRDATPRADYLEKFQCCTVHAVDYTIYGSFYTLTQIKMSFIEKFVRGVSLQRTDFAAAVDDSEIRVASNPTPSSLRVGSNSTSMPTTLKDSRAASTS